MKLISIFMLVLGITNAANAAEFEGSWKAKGLCEWSCRSNAVEIELVVPLAGHVEQVIIRLKGASFYNYDQIYTLISEESHSKNYDMWSTLNVGDTEVTYSSSETSYGLRDFAQDLRNISLQKVSNHEYKLSISESVSSTGISGKWRYYDYQLER
ncbi:MAG: hypothetical protein ACXWRU_20600 [Pseudobdellovibrionaceae bacterium]